MRFSKAAKSANCLIVHYIMKTFVEKDPTTLVLLVPFNLIHKFEFIMEFLFLYNFELGDSKLDNNVLLGTSLKIIGTGLGNCVAIAIPVYFHIFPNR